MIIVRSETPTFLAWALLFRYLDAESDDQEHTLDVTAVSDGKPVRVGA